MKSATQTKGNLFLIPNLISSSGGEISPEIINVVSKVKYYLAETPKSARKFLKSANNSISFETISVVKYDKSTSRQEVEELLAPLLKGSDVGIISDSGIPGIADPGSSAVLIAHGWGAKVKPLTGPSSVFLGLAASGLPGQRFCFNGYLPIHKQECVSKLKKLETESSRNNSSQIFIETPYRNEKLFLLLKKTLKPNTLLSVSYDVTGANETILTMSIKEWSKSSFLPGKLPCLFIIYSGS